MRAYLGYVDEAGTSINTTPRRPLSAAGSTAIQLSAPLLPLLLLAARCFRPTAGWQHNTRRQRGPSLSN